MFLLLEKILKVNLVSSFLVIGFGFCILSVWLVFRLDFLAEKNMHQWKVSYIVSLIWNSSLKSMVASTRTFGLLCIFLVLAAFHIILSFAAFHVWSFETGNVCMFCLNFQEWYQVVDDYDWHHKTKKLEDLGNILTSLDPEDSVVVIKSFLKCLAWLIY